MRRTTMKVVQQTYHQGIFRYDHYGYTVLLHVDYLSRRTMFKSLGPWDKFD